MTKISDSLSRRQILSSLAAAGLAVPAVPAFAQTKWPSSSVRVVVPYGPGASNDSFARALSNILQARFGQSFYVDNRPGAGGMTGTTLVSQAAADGYTLLENSSGISTMGPAQHSGFDASVDLTPIAMLGQSHDDLLVSASLPVHSVQEFIAYVKAHEGTFFYGSAGIGSTNQLHAELFNLRAGTKMRHAPYKGLAEALTDLGAGRIQAIFGTYGSAAGLIAAGKVRLIAYGAAGRTSDSPEAPVIGESVPNYEAKVWWGLFGPKSLPQDIATQLNEATNTAEKDPAYVKYLNAAGAFASPMSLDEFQAAVKKEIAITNEVIRAASIKFEE